MTGPITEWIFSESTFTCLFSCIQGFPSDFTRRCLSAPESGGSGAPSTAARHDNAPVLHHVTLNSPTPTSLLREWAKAALAGHSWKDSLVAAANASILFCPGILRAIDTFDLQFVVPRFTIYQVICERLETIHNITHASECFRQMENELAREIQGMEAKWVLGE